jgi:hypothetical protein
MAGGSDDGAATLGFLGLVGLLGLLGLQGGAPRPARTPPGPSLHLHLHLHFHLLPAMATEYPEIQGGGSLILAWQIRNKRVLVVGGGEVSRPHCAPPYVPHR